MPQRDITPEDFDCPKMTAKEAAEYLGLAESTLKKVRSVGELRRRKDPAYIKIGRRVFYFKKDLDAWKDQFKPENYRAWLEGEYR